MDYKEKYENALERARQVHTTNVDENKKSTGYIFPKLKESEDEKIRKKLIDLVNKVYIHTRSYITRVERVEMLAWLKTRIYTKKELQDMGFAFTTNGDIVTPKEQEKDLKAYLEHEKEKWLEKQGEQKPADNVEPKFHEGEWVACEGLNTAKIVDIVDDKYEVECIDGTKGFQHIDYIDRLFHLWTIEDAKNGDVLCFEDKIFIYNKWSIYYHYCYCNNNKPLITINGYFAVVKYQQHHIQPAMKEQRDLLFVKMKEAGYEWDAEKKELKIVMIDLDN